MNNKTKIKVKNERPSPPRNLGEWYDLHDDCRRTWKEVKIGEYHIHKCCCGDVTYVLDSHNLRGREAPLAPKGT